MQIIRSFFFGAILPAALLVGAGYQGLMAVNGPEGMGRAQQLEEHRKEREAEVDALRERQAALENRADRLVLASLDEDLLEQSVRANLGHMSPGEYRIPIGELDAVAAIEVSHEAELTTLIAVALLENTDV